MEKRKNPLKLLSLAKLHASLHTKLVFQLNSLGIKLSDERDRTMHIYKSKFPLKLYKMMRHDYLESKLANTFYLF